jgi:hypothetical protein
MSESQTEITLGVFNAVEENRNVTQRLVAKDPSGAPGLLADLPPGHVFTPSIRGIARQGEAAPAGEAQ